MKPYGIAIATAGQVLLAAGAEHYFVAAALCGVSRGWVGGVGGEPRERRARRGEVLASGGGPPPARWGDGWLSRGVGPRVWNSNSRTTTGVRYT